MRIIGDSKNVSTCLICVKSILDSYPISGPYKMKFSRYRNDEFDFFVGMLEPVDKMNDVIYRSGLFFCLYKSCSYLLFSIDRYLAAFQLDVLLSVFEN